MLLVGVIILGLVGAAAMAGAQSAERDPDGQAILAAQQQHEEEEAAFIQQGKDAVAAGDVEPDPGPPSFSPDPWPEGILGRDQADVGGGHFVNAWSGIVDGQYIGVYAGSTLDDPSAGLLLEQRIEDPMTMKSAWRRFETPIDGPVEVIAAEGTRLTVQSLSDEALTAVFDVATSSWR